jgi:hypothetical protein
MESEEYVWLKFTIKTKKDREIVEYKTKDGTLKNSSLETSYINKIKVVEIDKCNLMTIFSDISEVLKNRDSWNKKYNIKKYISTLKEVIQTYEDNESEEDLETFTEYINDSNNQGVFKELDNKYVATFPILKNYENKKLYIKYEHNTDEPICSHSHYPGTYNLIKPLTISYEKSIGHNYIGSGYIMCKCKKEYVSEDNSYKWICEQTN